ncbi:hydroxymethylbilane synthase [Novosphingopyxis iocasae]|uniref:hydroxymethylbilane synthase n=1 Tax=Novosphingopyxis iocasae TaxID=2762729 RepID=UPI001FEB7E5E|nr:hydroxymethylbilane synthase [Novosphingopyxis iocasae]
MAQTFSPDRPMRLGTRRSPLALAQAEMVKAALIAAHGWEADAVELVKLQASGDKVQDRALAEIGGKALWTKELDSCLKDGKIDAAVHSMKDVETIRPANLVIAAILPRADARDRLIGAPSIEALPGQARVGTASPRRAAQLLSLRPDLNIQLIRGNVGTRLAKIEAGEADATMLAAAGLDRLGMADIGTPIPESVMLPAPAQGAIGVETLAENEAVRAALSAIDDQSCHACVRAERAFLYALGADCHSPVAAHAVMKDERIHMRAQILTTDGSEQAHADALFANADGPAPASLARDLLGEASEKLAALFSGPDGGGAS